MTIRGGLTPRLQELLTFIRTFTGKHGHSPSFDEMAAAVGLKSKSGVSSMLARLEERGAIVRRQKQARAIEIIEAGARFSAGVENRIADYCRLHRVSKDAAITRAVEHFFGGRA